MDRYIYLRYNILLDTVRALAHIGVHIYTPRFRPIKFLAPLPGTKFSVILRIKQLDITLEFLFLFVFTSTGSFVFCFVCDCSQGYSERMQRQDQVDLHLFDPELERTLHILSREQRVVQNRSLAIMENNEEQDLNLQQNVPQRGRNGNNGRNQAPMPFIHPDNPFMLLEEFSLPPTVVQTAIRQPPIQANNFELKSVTLQCFRTSCSMDCLMRIQICI